MLNRNLLSRITTAAVLFTLFSAPVLAQQAAPQESDTTETDDTLLEEVIVVGTQIRGVEPVGAEPISLPMEDMVRTGLANTADIIRRLPQNQIGQGGGIGFQGGTANQGYNGAQVESVNLRGLGAAATLILIDGHRLVGQGGAATSTDANQVPVRALERLEILMDGASAVYGSDAVAGVVNFVLRKDFDGVEVTLRMDDQSGGDQYGGSLLAGNTWDSLGGLGSGNILLTYEHIDRDNFVTGKIPRLRQDLRPLGGPDLRLGNNGATVGFSPNIITQYLGPNADIPQAGNYTYFGVPHGDGTGLTSADLAYNQPNLADGADYADWTGEQTRDQLAVYFNQELTDNTEFFSSLAYTKRDTLSEFQSATVRVGLLGSPFYFPDLPPDQTVQYSFLKDGRVRTFSADATTISAVAGLRTQLGSDWESEVFLNYGKNEQCDSCVTNSMNINALTTQVMLGNINPLSSMPLTEDQAALVYGDAKYESRTTLEQVVAKFNGPLFELPAGPLLTAVGVEYREEANANRNTSRAGVANEYTQITTYGETKFDRDIWSAFVELNIPLAESLTASAAVRYDDYSDFGNTTNPKFGFNWDMTDKFRFQGTWGTSFRAPSVTDVNPLAMTSASVWPGIPNWDPDIVNGVLPAGILFPFGLTNAALILGSNPDLVPEEAETWTLTVGFAHEDLDISLTYWDIQYDDQILFPGTLYYLSATPADVPAYGGNYGGWESFIIPVYNPATCDNADIYTADPVLQPFLEAANYDFLAGGGDFSQPATIQDDFCKINVILDSRIQNIGRVEKAGIDFNLNYAFDISDVSMLTNFMVMHYLKNDMASQPGVPFESRIGENDGVFEWQATAGLTALWRGFDASLVARYLDDMVISGTLGADGLPAGSQRLSAYTQWDLTLGYSGDQGNVLQGWRAQLAITNVTDAEPDFFVGAASSNGSNAWDFRYGLPFGRTYALEFTVTF